MHISDLLDMENLRRRLDEGYILKNQHPDLPLDLYCYSTSAQLEWVWDHETMQCRGLIVERDTGKVVSRPFKKFGTYEQHLTWSKNGYLPQGHFQAYEKLDGSLGVMYPIPGYEGMLEAIATKGSFTSEQAMWATDWVADKDDELRPVGTTSLFDTANYTYLFEIIYPENRVVVNYGDRAEVVLLDVLEIETGARSHAEFQRIESYGWPVVQSVQVEYSHIDHLASMYQQVSDDEEGFVLVYDNGIRLKVKGERYLELHKLKENLVPKRIIQAFIEGGTDWVAGLPDEFQPEVVEITGTFEKNRLNIAYEVKLACRLVDNMPRKRAAETLKRLAPHVMPAVFATMDSRFDKRDDWINRRATERTLVGD